MKEDGWVDRETGEHGKTFQELALLIVERKDWSPWYTLLGARIGNALGQFWRSLRDAFTRAR